MSGTRIASGSTVDGIDLFARTRTGGGASPAFELPARHRHRAGWDCAALLLAGRCQVGVLFVAGRQGMRDGTLTTLDLPRRVERAVAELRT